MSPWKALRSPTPRNTVGVLRSSASSPRPRVQEVSHSPTRRHGISPGGSSRVGDRGFAATHLFHATPLTIGYGNNPFTVNAEGSSKDPKVEVDGSRLALRWFHEVNDPAIARLMARPSVAIVNGRTAIEQDAMIRWEPKVDWLYRQYMVGLGESAEAAEGALRGSLGAAAGWIDRPVSEEDVASLLVGMMDDIGRAGQSAEIGLLKIVPAVLSNNAAAINAALRDRAQDYPARTETYLDLLRRTVAEGGKPAGGSKLLPDGTRREGWTGNPCYHASLMPCHVRILEHFDLPFSREAHRQAILRYADFGLELLGGQPVDFDRLRSTLEAEWPSRVVPTIPLMLHAYSLKPDAKYARAATILFEDLHFAAGRAQPARLLPRLDVQPAGGQVRYRLQPGQLRARRAHASFWFQKTNST